MARMTERTADPSAAASDEDAAARQTSVPPWVVIARGAPQTEDTPPLRPRRVLLQLALGVLAVLLLVGLLGSLAARKLAEREAVNDAAHTAGVLAAAVVEPALTDALLDGDPGAVPAFDRVVRDHVLGQDIVRVKIWRPDGLVLYADEPALIGRTFDLGSNQQAALDGPMTRAEISDLDATENAFEDADRLVEVYRPVWTSSGRPALFELYASYDPVGARATQMWRGFAGVTASSLILLIVLVAPIVWHLLTRLRAAERQRVVLLQRAVDASDLERRRIAATLHDGPVQELAATGFAVAGAAAAAGHRGETRLAGELDAAAGSVRGSMRALRTLLVDIYPPSLGRSGIVAALHDLAQGIRRPDLAVRLDTDTEEELDVTDAEAGTIHRVAQECLRNAAKHAGAASVVVSLRREGREVVLEVVDDGAGMDVEGVVADPEPGHLGLSLLRDAAAAPGATLQVASAPGAGTHWRLALPSEETRR